MRAHSYIYGAGGMGREVLAHRRSIGRPVDGFIDRAAARIGIVDGVPVIGPESLDDLADAAVLVALHNPGVDVAAVVAGLHQRGCTDVSTLWSTCRQDAWRPAMAFWLDPSFAWEAARDEIARARALMGDATSRRVFDEQVRLREHGDYDGLSAPTPDDQYVPRDLARWADPMRLVDCGAFDGDTLRTFESHGYAIAAALALEPDPVNFERLRRHVERQAAVRALKVGVHSASGTLSFASGGATSSRVDTAGATVIDVVRLDDVCRDLAPTLIKMDIEGAERDALEGSRQILASCRPALAISAYHRVDDLWWLALWIDDLDLGYRFEMRSHAYTGFETVLYARVDP